MAKKASCVRRSTPETARVSQLKKRTSLTPVKKGSMPMSMATKKPKANPKKPRRLGFNVEAMKTLTRQIGETCAAS